MGERIQAAQTTHSQDHTAEPGHHPQTCRRPAGRKPGPAPQYEGFGRQLDALVRHCFPKMNQWLEALPDPRRQDLCTYKSRHIWWQIVLTFLLRGGSRNAFDGDRNTGQLPSNVLQLCEQVWDEERFGTRRTVTCSGNAVYHASRIAVSAVAEVPVKMVRRLMQMRLLDSGRLFDRWWLIAIDGTLQDRGYETKEGEARHRYTLAASLVGPYGMTFPLMSEFMDMRDPVRDKEDCELNAFMRLATRLRAEFPHLLICLLLDGLYPVKSVFDTCAVYGWKFIATLREGRQPSSYDEAVQTMVMSPSQVFCGLRDGEDGPVEQTLRWTKAVPFGKHELQVLFSGEISPVAATLWVWVTNFELNHERVYDIANHGGRARNSIENLFNVEKNGGFGLEHTFCANPQASQNYHLMLQVAFILWQLLAKGVLHRLTQMCRKVTDIKMVELLRTSLMSVLLDPADPSFGQLRFCSSA
jgi:hypothetical protein